MAKKRDEADEDVMQRLDAMLAAAGRMAVELIQLEREMEQRIEAVRQEYEESIRRCRADLDRMDAEITNTAKAHDAMLFRPDEPECWVRLRNGTLIRTIERRVKRGRGVLERLERLGRMDVIKIAKSVDWAKLEGWDDSELAAVGTERVERVKYGYDLTFGGGHGQEKAAGKGAHPQTSARAG